MKNTKFKFSKIELTIIKRFFDNIKSTIIRVRKTNLILKYGNKITIFLLVFTFLYLTYLSLPGLLNKQLLETSLKKRILEDFNLKIDTSVDINYTILPTPQFIISNVTILNKDNEKYKGILIKKFKVKISQKNLFSYKNFIINHLKLEDVIVKTDRSNLNIFIDFFSKELSKKKVYINKTKLIYGDSNKETILIIPLKKLIYNYNQEINSNILNVNGKLFNQPFNLIFKKQISENQETGIIFTLKNINFKIHNNQHLNIKELVGNNVLNLGKRQLHTKYSIKDDLLIFSSFQKDTKNQNLNYRGKVNLKPFEFNINIKNEKLKTNQIIESYYFFLELFRNKIIINQNFNGKLVLKINDISNSKLLNKLKIQANFINDMVEFENSTITLGNFAELEFVKGDLDYSNNYPKFNGQFVLDIKNINSFYRFFQVPLKYRGSLDKIFFSLKFNLDNEDAEIVQIYFDDKSHYFVSEDIIEELNLFLNKKNFFNLNNFRSFINKLFFKINLA